MNPETLAYSAATALAGLIIGYVAGQQSTKPRRIKKKKSNRPQRSSGDGTELYVGNLSYDIDDARLEKEFKAFGSVLSARVIKNKYNDRSRGYGFVEMANDSGADKAIDATHGKEIMGRKLVVNVARSSSRD